MKDRIKDIVKIRMLSQRVYLGMDIRAEDAIEALIELEKLAVDMGVDIDKLKLIIKGLVACLDNGDHYNDTVGQEAIDAIEKDGK